MTEGGGFLLLVSLRNNRSGTGGRGNQTTIFRCTLWVLLKVQTTVGTSVQHAVILTKVRGRNRFDILNQQPVVVGDVQSCLERYHIASIVERFHFVGRDSGGGNIGGSISE